MKKIIVLLMALAAGTLFAPPSRPGKNVSVVDTNQLSQGGNEYRGYAAAGTLW